MTIRSTLVPIHRKPTHRKPTHSNCSRCNPRSHQLEVFNSLIHKMTNLPLNETEYIGLFNKCTNFQSLGKFLFVRLFCIISVSLNIPIVASV